MIVDIGGGTTEIAVIALEDRAHGIRRLRAVLEPVLGPLDVQRDLRLRVGRHRVVQPERLQGAPVPRRPRPR